MTRDEALSVVVAEFGFEDAEALKDWEAIPAMYNGEYIGTLTVHGTEVHFTAPPDKRHRMQRDFIREFLRPVFERRGMLTTRVLHDEVEKREPFLKKLGFERTRASMTFQHYMLTELPFQRK